MGKHDNRGTGVCMHTYVCALPTHPPTCTSDIILSTRPWMISNPAVGPMYVATRRREFLAPVSQESSRSTTSEISNSFTPSLTWRCGDGFVHNGVSTLRQESSFRLHGASFSQNKARRNRFNTRDRTYRHGAVELRRLEGSRQQARPHDLVLDVLGVGQGDTGPFLAPEHLRTMKIEVKNDNFSFRFYQWVSTHQQSSSTHEQVFPG